MNVTAFINASIAYPNALGHASLARALYYGKPLICAVIETCLRAQHIRDVVLVTSDHEVDRIFHDDIATIKVPVGKTITIHSIPAHESYSFVPTRQKMRALHFPYLWFLGRGWAHGDGFKALMQQYKAHHAFLCEVEQCWGLTTHALDALCEKSSDTIAEFAGTHLFHVMWAVNVSYLLGLIAKNTNKILERAAKQSNSPMLFHVGESIEPDERKKSINEVSLERPIALYRDQEYRMFTALSSGSTHSFDELYACVRNYYTSGRSYYVCVDAEKGHLTYEHFVTFLTSKIHALVLHIKAGETAVLHPDFVRCLQAAKDQGITSVWVEVKRSLLTEASLRAFIKARIDVLMLDVNGDEMNPQHVEETSDSIARIRTEEQVLFPYVVFVYTISSWLHKEHDVFLRRIEKKADRLILRSPHTRVTGSGNIDFTPLHRMPCRVLFQSAYYDAELHERVCRCDEGAVAHGADRGALRKEILREQVRGIYGDVFALCRLCTEWCIPSLLESPLNSALIQMEKPFIPPVWQGLRREEVDRRVLLIEAMIHDLNDMYANITEEMRCIEKRLSSEKEVTIQLLLKRDNAFRMHALKIVHALMRAMRVWYIPCGEAYILHAHYNEGLAVWERVLQFDPANEYIHKRLDELLEKTQC